ncbi:MAG: M50 family metallopeptidase [Anaerolineales bacterium]|nr:M50 family metallopeptidase [Anaerolineales bacterium]
MALKKSRFSRFNGRLALALPASYYLTNTLRLLVHELGHGLMAKALGGEFVDLYLAPSVVGYAYWQGPENSPISDLWLDILVTSAGVLATVLFWGIVLMIVSYEMHRRQNWLLSVLAIGGVTAIAYDLAYLTISPFLQWGDGYDLAQLLSAWVPFVTALLLLLFLFPTGLNLLGRAIQPYLNLDNIPRLSAFLIVTLLPSMLYGTLKAALFLPEQSQIQLISLGALVAACILGAPLAWPVMRSQLHQPLARPAYVPGWLVGMLLVAVLAVEFSCTWYFGF